MVVALVCALASLASISVVLSLSCCLIGNKSCSDISACVDIRPHSILTASAGRLRAWDSGTSTNVDNETAYNVNARRLLINEADRRLRTIGLMSLLASL